MNILGLITLPDTLVLLGIVLTVLYVYTTKDHGVFKAIGVPGPKALPIIGNRSIFKLPCNERYTYLRETYGQVYGIFMDLGFSMLLFPTLVIGQLDLVREITIKEFSLFKNRMSTSITQAQVPPISLNLFDSEDAYWKTFRTMLSPTFTSGKLKKMVDAINTASKTLASCLKTPAENKQEIIARDFTGPFTMDVIASVAMGVDLNCQQNPEDKFVKNIQAILQAGQTQKFLPTLWAVAVFPFLAPFVRKWTVFMGWKDPFFDDGPMRFFENSISEIISLRQTTNKKYADFLQLMQDAKISTSSDDYDGDADQTDGFHHTHINTPSEKSYRKLTRDELVAQSFLFFVAGHETTAAGLMFSLYNLALFPEVQDRLVTEINEHVPKDNDPDYEAVGKCQYLERFIMETLRLYPSVGIFLPEKLTTHHPAQWMPFGIGPRQCLGTRFALLEMKIALIHIIREYKISKTDNTQIPLKLGTTDLVGAVETPVKIRVENREAI